jgi:hypothetical protein
VQERERSIEKEPAMSGEQEKLKGRSKELKPGTNIGAQKVKGAIKTLCERKTRENNSK